LNSAEAPINFNITIVLANFDLRICQCMNIQRNQICYHILDIICKNSEIYKGKYEKSNNFDSLEYSKVPLWGEKVHYFHGNKYTKMTGVHCISSIILSCLLKMIVKCS
jgi:hypothetical protein